MTLHEMASALMLLLREGSISDDEKLDIRLVKDLIKTKRAEYIGLLNGQRGEVSSNNMQHIDVDMELLSNGILRSTEKLPRIIASKVGKVIDDISVPETFGTIDFTYVNSKRLPVVGNGKYNQNLVYATVAEDYLLLKAKNHAFRLITKCEVEAAFEDPTDVEGFNDMVDEYPIDVQGFEYIKKAMFKEDLTYFLMGSSDLSNNADGEIIQK